MPPERACGVARVLPRGRAREFAGSAAPPRRPRRGRARCAAAAGRAAHERGYLPGEGAVTLDALAGSGWRRDAPWCRSSSTASALLAADTAPIDALCAGACGARTSLRRRLLCRASRIATRPHSCATRFTGSQPAVIVTTTAFAAGGEGESFAARCGRRAGAASGDRHDAARRLAGEPARSRARPTSPCMWCCPSSTAACLPAPSPSRMRCRTTTRSAFTAFASRPEPDRVAMVADRIAALVRLQRDATRERRIAVLMPDYPGRGRPRRLCRRPRRAGKASSPCSPISPKPATASALHRRARGTARGARRGHGRSRALSLRDYRRLLAELPAEVYRERVEAAWGEPEDDPDFRDGAFRFRAAKFGNVLVALPPDRGRARDRRAAYHDPTLPPRHAVLALRSVAASRRQGRCHRAYGRARHAGMAAGQGRGADRLVLSRSGGRDRCR